MKKCFSFCSGYDMMEADIFINQASYSFPCQSLGLQKLPNKRDFHILIWNKQKAGNTWEDFRGPIWLRF